MKKLSFIACLLLLAQLGFAQDRPNILVIMVDDVAPNSLGAYTMGMQYPTPNIDRIANEGVLFTDHYSQPSCTAGRAAFIMGQVPVRTGLTTVGQPGNPLGIKPEDPTIAELLKPLGYMTAQYGKNHLGDRNEHLPTVHGFDEFFGNLYHLNVSEEPEQADYPKTEEFKNTYGPRGIIESYASDKYDDTVDPRFGVIGKQKVTDIGQLSSKRMETFDEELVAKTKDFMKRAKDADKPFFIWHATSRMHVYTHLKEESRNLATPISTDMDLFGSGLMEHDGHVGMILDYMDELGLTDNTIVIYTTDNGPEQSTWPDAGVTMFRGEKMTTWEGGLRAPFLVRWPGKIPAGLKRNGISSHEDVLPTLMAAVGNPNISEELLAGKKVGDMTYKVHIDGFNNLDYWTGKTDVSARNHFFYYYEANLTALRVGPWKMHFATKTRYFDDMVTHTMPRLFNLRKDPFEKYDDVYAFELIMHKSWVFQPAIGVLNNHLSTFIDFPPRQASASLDINKAIEKIMNSSTRN
ncbi:arylsulfatase [Algoriphagus zhangzhouensis]|uniref:Arylsulfatase n=1 Tax=Algoriphagus zhangzhouensis TaxID=1073327 RepID=A0A1M7ZEH7_9BACT|nr:arylsulfatase [Algoriphagus zhangzhouensis]TDY46048.1 arylsulfatase [Algoriphagus zhangzhouensis]SHO63287.1 arylsulfatase [Algoriphagus zhangzhouensis]